MKKLIRNSTDFTVSGFGFDFIVIYDSDDLSNTIEQVVRDAFTQNDCKVIGYELRDVTDIYVESDPKKWGDFDVFQVGVDFKWTEDYSESNIISNIKNNMKDIGCSVIGNPEFYSEDI